MNFENIICIGVSVLLSLSSICTAVYYYRKFIKLSRKYKYAVSQLNIASGIFYGKIKGKAMPTEMTTG